MSFDEFLKWIEYGLTFLACCLIATAVVLGVLYFFP
jgi:hypothetical protein